MTEYVTKTLLFRLPNILRIDFLILENRTYRLHETSVKYQHTLHNNPEERRAWNLK